MAADAVALWNSLQVDETVHAASLDLEHLQPRKSLTRWPRAATEKAAKRATDWSQDGTRSAGSLHEPMRFDFTGDLLQLHLTPYALRRMQYVEGWRTLHGDVTRYVIHQDTWPADPSSV